ncbi:hypothetical protein GOV10_05545, partial [Candidatus Woesearchaeota archaeon]|nr:hypothetical protein [Candidatus Woesearchaeota archaeon]
MAKILIQLPRFVEDEGRRIQITSFEKFYLDNIDRTFSTKKATFRPEELAKNGFLEKKKDSYLLMDSDFVDDYKQLKRLAQIITLKDIGRIITLLGLTKESIVVEAGSGSGAAGIYLAKVVK